VRPKIRPQVPSTVILGTAIAVLAASAPPVRAGTIALLHEAPVAVRTAPESTGPFLDHVQVPESRMQRVPTPRVETYVDLVAELFAPGKADPQEWMATGTWARVTYDGFNYDYGYDPLAQTYDLLVSGYAVQGGIIVQESVGVMAVSLPATLQSGQIERVECWFRVSEHNLFPFEWVGITALEDDIEPSSSLNSLDARLLYEDARGFRGVAYAVDHFANGAHAIDLGYVAVTHLENALLGKKWFGVGFAADGWDLSGSLGEQVFWRVSGGGALPLSVRPFFRVVYNAPPGVFAITSPVAGAVVTQTRPELQWTAAVDPNGDAPLTYRVLLSNAPDLASGVEFSVVDQTSAQPPLALTGGTYYWRVDAFDPAGARREGPTSSFTIAVPTDAPATIATSSISCSPNPFNPRTEIRLEVARSGPARVEVLDARGRRVRVLHQGVLERGTHRLDWDGTDTRGRACASGAYEVRAECGGEVLTERIALVR
jgi:hypothetical protein